MTRAYPTETVDCPRCDGLGEDIDAPDDPLDWHGNRCVDCFGRGTVEVCANCLDESYEGCSECNPARLPCGHLQSDLTSSDTATFCAVCAVAA
jgi:hypothetical protein